MSASADAVWAHIERLAGVMVNEHMVGIITGRDEAVSEYLVTVDEANIGADLPGPVRVAVAPLVAIRLCDEWREHGHHWHDKLAAVERGLGDATLPVAWTAWLDGQPHPELDALYGRIHPWGRMLTAACEQAAAGAWYANRPDLVTDINTRWQQAARAAVPGGEDWGNADTWDPQILTTARERAVTDPEENAAAARVFHALLVEDPETRSVVEDPDWDAVRLAPRLRGVTPRRQFPGIAGRAGLTTALLYGADGRLRLAAARAEAGNGPDARRDRARWRWVEERADLITADHLLGFTLDDEQHIHARVREALATPEAFGGAADEGGEIIVPAVHYNPILDAQTLTEPDCEGIRILVATGPVDDGRPALRCYFGFTFAHGDARGVRRVTVIDYHPASEATGGPWRDVWSLEHVYRRAASLDHEITSYGSWDDQRSWFGQADTTIGAEPSTERFGAPACAHRRWEWMPLDHEDYPYAAHSPMVRVQRCRECGARLRRTDAWRLEPTPSDLDGATEEAVLRARALALLADQDPADVPTSIRELRRRDGAVPLRPATQSVAPARSLRDTLGVRPAPADTDDTE